MSYKITKDDEAYWLQISANNGKTNAAIKLESNSRIVTEAIKEAYEEQSKPPPEPSAEELRGLINEILPVGDIADGLAPYYIESDTIHRMRKALEGKE